MYHNPCFTFENAHQAKYVHEIFLLYETLVRNKGQSHWFWEGYLQNSKKLNSNTSP